MTIYMRSRSKSNLFLPRGGLEVPGDDSNLSLSCVMESREVLDDCMLLNLPFLVTAGLRVHLTSFL